MLAVKLSLGSSFKDCNRGNSNTDYIRNNIDESEPSNVIVIYHRNKDCSSKDKSPQEVNHKLLLYSILCVLKLVVSTLKLT